MKQLICGVCVFLWAYKCLFKLLSMSNLIFAPALLSQTEQWTLRLTLEFIARSTTSSFQPVKKVLDLKLFFLRIFVRELKNKISRSLNLWVHNGKSIFQASLLPGCLQLVINKWQVIPCMQESVCVDLQLIPWDIPHKKKTGFKFWFWILDKKKEEKEKRKKME